MNNKNQSLNFTSIIEPKINKCIEQLKDFINHFSLLPVLEKTYINDNFIYVKDNGATNEDCKLSLYVGDLFLTYQKDKNLKIPTTEQTETIFNLLLELVRFSMAKDMMENRTDISSIDYKTLFKYTERSFYIQVMVDICQNVLDEKWLQYFYNETGFYLQDVFTFNFVYKSILYDRYEKNNCSLFSFSVEELLCEFKKLDNSISKERLNSFINYFTCKDSNNSDYLISVNNPLKHRPIIHIDSQIICCDSLILIKDVFFLLEEVIKKDEKFFTEYGTDKGNNFEKLVQTIFNRFFPNASFYSGLEYITEDKKQHEADLIIDTGNYLIIVESKGRSFQENAKKGNFGSYKRSIENTIKKAHEQCKTTYNYILSKDNVVFKKKEEDYSFSKKSYFDIYLVTVELDNLDSITSDIHKTLDVFETNPIITFSIYDLLIFQDILERGSLFLNYLDQRRGSIKQKKTSASIELDYLSYYINTGLFFDKQEEILRDEFSELSIGNFSDEIDKYYFGEIKEKPKYPIEIGLYSLFQQLEKCNSKISLTIEKELTSTDSKTQKNIVSQIEKLKQQAQIRFQSSVFSFVLESKIMGISFICFSNKYLIPDTNYFFKYIKEKKSSCSVHRWILIVFSLNPYEVTKILLVE